MKVELVTETKGVGKLEGKSLEQIIGYIARVSNPNNQDNESVEGLLKYCIKHRHWSIFQQAYLGFEVETTRSISPQILRHLSFDFQEHSQRYSSDIITMELYPPRRQDKKNRQNSIDDLPSDVIAEFNADQLNYFNQGKKLYKKYLSKDVSKESVRTFLPPSVITRMYINGSIRSWMHYIVLRSANGTQKEHSDIAKEMHRIIADRYPLTGRLIDFMIKADEAHKEILESLKID